MKHKRSESGFAHYLLLAIIPVIAVVSLSGWYVYNHQASDSSADNSDFVANAIMVDFKDAVTFQQASQLIHSYGLTINHEDISEDGFIPKSYRGIKTEKFDDILNKLRTYKEINTVFDDSADPANNRAGPGEKWMEIIWQQDVSYERIKQIQVATGYGLSSQPQGIIRSLYISAPAGKEDYYVSKLNHEAIVKHAEREGKPVPLSL